jgi:hypothetical protein
MFALSLLSYYTNRPSFREIPIYEVIDNLEQCDDFYMRRTLRFASIDHDMLTDSFFRAARDTRAATEAMLLVLHVSRLILHHKRKDNHVYKFLEFAFNNFKVAFVGTSSERELADDILRTAKLNVDHLLWYAPTVSKTHCDEVRGVIVVDVPASCIDEEVRDASNLGIINLTPFTCNPDPNALETESEFSHGGSLRHDLWACLHADPTQLRRFLTLRAL